MPIALVVVESPGKAKTINKFLGKEYKVMACMGHVRDLPVKELGIDIEEGFRPKYRTIRGKGKVLKQLRSAAKSAGTIILATDPDREGEAIAWHVAHELGREPQDVQRVMFSEITDRAVTEAVASPGEIDLHKVDAQQARRILDRLVGYQVSPFLWKTIHGGLSAGRVQSVALRLICEREEEVEAFVPEEYWTIEALVKKGQTDPFTARLVSCRGEKPAITNQEEAERITSELQSSADSDGGYRIDKVVRREQRRNPSPPFITSTLQQEAARRLRFSARKTMMVAQQLYEGIDVDGEATGLITYMRTDSTRLAPEAVEGARSYIESQFGPDYVPKTPRQYKRGKAAQDAHEAIRPTDLELLPATLESGLNRDQLRLYRLIWERFIACQMAPAVFDRTTVEITAGDHGLRATGSILKFPGFTALYTEGTDDEKEEAEGRLPDSLAEGDQLALQELDPQQHFTKPPPRYSDATLVKELEAQEIGRPSTYHTIISTLLDRDYATKDRGRFVPSELGRTVTKILVVAFPDIFNVDFTARMEDELDQVANGNVDWVKVVTDFYGPFSKDLNQLESQTADLKRSLQEETGEACEKCGDKMVIKWGRNGKFIACSGFPKCRNTRPLDEEDAPEIIDEKCESCGAQMMVRTGRNGKFLGCSAYPECRNTRPLKLGVPCPKDGCEGELVERSSRRGRTFYGCDRYPDCDFATWAKPLKQECPACSGPFLAEHTSRKGDSSVKCLKCKHTVPDGVQAQEEESSDAEE